MMPSQTVVMFALLQIAPVGALNIKLGKQDRLQLRGTIALASADYAKHINGSDLQLPRGDDPENATKLTAASTKRITVSPKRSKPMTPKKLKTREAMMPAQPTGGPSKQMTAAEMTGVSANAAGDLDAFLSALVVNAVLIGVFFLVASILRRRYPNVYSWNSEKGPEDDPERWTKHCDKETDPAFFGWWTMSASVTIDDVVAKRGLDIGMLLQFCEDAKYILLCIGLPLLLFVSPQHAFMGGYRAGNDYLSYLGMANVVDGHPFLYWEHAFFTWFVVVFLERQIFSCFRNFKTRRMKWLQAMPTPRSTTVLVENIPRDRDLLDETKLTEYLNKIFNRKDAVKKVNMIKDTTQLLKKISARNAEKDLYDEVVHKLEEMKTSEPATDSATLKAQEEKKETSETKLRQLLQEVDDAREEVLKDAKQENSTVNLSVAFVTFSSRRDAELAKQMIFTSHADEFEIDVPPEPSDVIYADLQSDPRAQQVRDLLGYCLIAGVFWAYVPTVVGIAYYASIETLAKTFPIFQDGAANPEFAALWDGIVVSQVLTQVMGFVPTFFVLIFSNLFILKARAWLQYRIQFWYFYFQVIFILLVTTVGNSLSGLLHDIGEDPGSVFYLLASSLPQASHFYLNFLPAQWVSHATNLMRIVNLFKYKTWSLVYGEDKGKEKSEPEDQDYYGIGSRSARFSFMFVLSLSFCLLSPLMTALGWVNFWICRKVYGYLCVYAETKKPDLGGVFYMSMLRHVQEAMFIFTVLMSGVLTMRDSSWWPGAIAGSALGFQVYYYKKFVLSLRWESLSFDEMADYDEGSDIHEDVDYVQPELCEQDHSEFLPKTS